MEDGYVRAYCIQATRSGKGRIKAYERVGMYRSLEAAQEALKVIQAEHGPHFEVLETMVKPE